MTPNPQPIFDCKGLGGPGLAYLAEQDAGQYHAGHYAAHALQGDGGVGLWRHARGGVAERINVTVKAEPEAQASQDQKCRNHFHSLPESALKRKRL